MGFSTAVIFLISLILVIKSYRFKSLSILGYIVNLKLCLCSELFKVKSTEEISKKEGLVSKYSLF